MKRGSSLIVRTKGSQVISLGVFALLMCSCEKEASKDPKTLERKSERKLGKSQTLTSNAPIRNDNGRPVSSVELEAGYSKVIEENKGRLSSLLEYCREHVPDSKKADFMIAVAGAAGQAGDAEFIERLLESNPGAIKNLGLEAYASKTEGVAGINGVFNLVSDDLLPEEKDAIWKGLVTPLLTLPARELANFFSAGLPAEFQDRMGGIVGINLGNVSPREAKSIIRTFPSNIQKGIESIYWRQLGATNPDLARQAFESGQVPESAWTSVGRDIVNPMIRDESLEAALKYAEGRENSKQQEDLSNYVFDLWMKNDSIAASERAAKLPPGPALDGAARAIALRMEKLGDKKGAAQWRALIGKKQH